MKKLLFSLVLVFVGLALFFSLFSKIGLNAIKQSFVGIFSLKGFTIIFLGFFITFLGTLRWKNILKSKGYVIPLKDLFGHYLAGFAIAYLAPMAIFGREVFKGYILKGSNGISYEKGMSASFIDGIFEYISEWIIVLLGLSFFFLRLGFFSTQPKIIFLTLFIFIGALLIFAFIAFRKKSIIKLFLDIDKQNQGLIIEKEVFNFFELKNKTFHIAIIFSIIKIFAKLAQYSLLLILLNESISISTAFSVLGISVLAMAPPISADLGTHDWASVILFDKLGMEPATGAAFASIIRAVNLLISFVGIIFLIKFGFESLKDSLFNKIERLFKVYERK
ncbi:MAG: flippase-like domain-containing protein [Candidatus Pacebacteria bacterium]|nr:flippase-like domain-containing protein [Candidatus Paceibacterota bacterium]